MNNVPTSEPDSHRPPASSDCWAGWLVLSVLALVALGCGGGDIERCVVTGAVTLDDAPVQNGEIHFVPINNTKGPIWAAYITNGQYSAAGKGGVPVGEHRVEIDAWREVKVDYGEDKAGDLGDGIERISIIPIQYRGKQSTLRLKIEPGSGKIEKDFHLDKKEP